MTGLQPFGDKSFTWNGATEAQGLDWAANQPGNSECATFSTQGLKSASCDKRSNFMCEAKIEPESTTFKAVKQKYVQKSVCPAHK